MGNYQFLTIYDAEPIDKAQIDMKKIFNMVHRLSTPIRMYDKTQKREVIIGHINVYFVYHNEGENKKYVDKENGPQKKVQTLLKESVLSKSCISNAAGKFENKHFFSWHYG